MDLRLERATTQRLPAGVRQDLRAFLDAVFEGDFSDADFEHTIGGTHVWCEDPAGLVAHASVVPRRLATPGARLRTGYVEAVATRVDARRRGVGSAVMRAIAEVVAADFEIGALSSSQHPFYVRLGWEPWVGPTHCAPAGSELSDRDGWVRTADEDGGIMVLRVPKTPPLDRSAPIACDWRSGDVW